MICDVAAPRNFVPKTEFQKIDVRDRQAVRAVVEAARPDVLVHLAFILNPTHDEGFMYDVDVNGTHNVLDAAAAAGVGPGARDHLGGGLRRVPGQPGAAHRGRSGPRRGALLVRARQDRVRPHLPAVGARASGPGAHDRAALHRVRAERGQLPGAALDQDAVHGRRGHARPADPVRPRGRRGGGRDRPASGPPRRRLQRGRRRAHDDARVRRADRLARCARCRSGPTARSPA